MKKKFQNIFGYGGVIHLYMKVRVTQISWVHGWGEKK
jgi:hypothetical protein